MSEVIEDAEDCNTCGDTGRWESTFEEAPTVLVDLGPCQIVTWEGMSKPQQGAWEGRRETCSCLSYLLKKKMDTNGVTSCISDDIDATSSSRNVYGIPSFTMLDSA